MGEIPVSGAVAEYRGRRVRILFSSQDWIALLDPGVDVPDGFERGEAPAGLGHHETWVKVPRSAVDGIVHTVVSGTLAGHTVSLQRQLPDGRIRIEFIGPPAVARQLGLQGDQYMGWAGLIDPDDLSDIRVEETRHV